MMYCLIFISLSSVICDRKKIVTILGEVGDAGSSLLIG